MFFLRTHIGYIFFLFIHAYCASAQYINGISIDSINRQRLQPSGYNLQPFQNILYPSYNSSAEGIKMDRFYELENKLRELARKDIKGLNDPVDFSVSGSSIQEFLRAIAEANNLNINIDPTLNFKIVNNFTNEKVINVLLFICREYDLNIRFTGNIMSFYKQPQTAPPVYVRPPKEIIINYNAYNDQLSLDLANDTLEKVAKKITQVTKKNLILSPGLNNKQVSVYIENMPFDHAIDKLAYANNLKADKTKDNFYVLEPIETVTNEPNINSTGFANSRVNVPTRNRKSESTDSGVEIFIDSLGRKRLTLNITNQSVADVIRQVSKEMQINYFMFSDPKGNTTAKLFKATYEEMLSYLLQGTEHTYKKENGIYLIGERALEGLRLTKVIQLQYRSSEIIMDNIPVELKKGVDIKYFKELNSLILSGSSPQIQDIISFVKELDKVVPMIQIEAIIVNVSKSRSTSTGIKASFNDTIRGGGSILPGLDFTFNSKRINDILNGLSNNNLVNLGRVNASFYVTLSALEKLNNADVQQTPKLSTLNGHEATLKIGQTRYYEIQTQNITGSLTTNTIRTVQYQSAQANLAIKITPIVSGDDQITMDIDFENSGFTDIPAAGPPPTQTSAFKSIIRVKNQEMIVLGGLESEEKSETGSGVPILSRIPILKWLFSSKTKSKVRRKQLIFIRPTIIY